MKFIEGVKVALRLAIDEITAAQVVVAGALPEILVDPRRGTEQWYTNASNHVASALAAIRRAYSRQQAYWANLNEPSKASNGAYLAEALVPLLDSPGDLPAAAAAVRALPPTRRAPTSTRHTRVSPTP